jgi:hypothetical protein
VAESCIDFASVALGPDPVGIRTEYFTLSDGEHGVLKLGGGLSIATASTSPEALRKLAVAALELADWREQQDVMAAREQVSA